jgi:tRNA 2-thiouridine synthesizing protein A
MSRLNSGERDVSGAAAGEVQELDVRGIRSPLHVLRAHRALRGMRAGQLLRVTTSSEQTLAEFQALSKYVVSYELVSQERIGDAFVHVLRKKR